MPASRITPLLLSIALSVSAFAGDAEDIANSLVRGDAGDALASADKALIKSPRDARLRLLRGNALAQLGRIPEAIQVFAALTTDYPTLPEPFNNLAALYAQQGQLDKARTTLQMALQTNPAYATAHANLADVYAKLAAQSYEKALQRDVVERQNGQSAAPATPATPRLALVQDLVSSHSTGASTTIAAKPLVVAALPMPAASTPAPVAKAPASPIAPPVAKPTEKPATTATKMTPPPIVVAAVEKKTTTPANPPPVGLAPVKPVAPSTATAKAPAAITTKPESGKDAESQVLASVHGWADAWSQKRVSVYLASYAKGFKPGGISRSEWEKQRRDRIEAAHKIEVKLSNIKVKLEGDTASVHFVQRYKSDRLDSSTAKTLTLEKNGSRWLIREERVG